MIVKKIILSISFLYVVLMLYGQEQQNPFITPSQLGATGLIYTPSAYIPTWATFDIGFTHYTSKASLTYEAGEAPERTLIGSVAFLPRAELSFKVTRPYSNLVKDSTKFETYYGIGDRSISLRIQLVKERAQLPAIVIGIQDPFSASSFFSTNYIVLSKKYQLGKVPILANIGYGTSFEALEIRLAKAEFLRGLFGGVQGHWKSFSGKIEYDTKRVNIGVGYHLKNKLFFNIALIEGRYLAGNINFRFRLKQQL